MKKKVIKSLLMLVIAISLTVIPLLALSAQANELWQDAYAIFLKNTTNFTESGSAPPYTFA